MISIGVLSSAAMADNWSMGVSVLGKSAPYKGIKASDYITPIPVINYDSEKFYLHTLSVGYYLWKDKKNQISLDAFYYPQLFKPKDNDDEAMRKLSSRRDTVMAGLTYRYKSDWGILRLIGSGDILGISNGLRADTAYLYGFHGDKWSFTPGVGIKWDDKNQTSYEYGVSSKESRNSGLKYYEPNDSLSPYIELSGKYSFNESWTIFAMGRMDFLSSEVTDSPMVDKDTSTTIWSGFLYTF